MKPGEEVVSVNVGWTVEKFVEEEKKEIKTKSRPKGKPATKTKPTKKTSPSKGKKK